MYASWVEEDTDFECIPQISAHHYDTAYHSNLQSFDSQAMYRNRYSMPTSNNLRAANLQDNEDISPPSRRKYCAYASLLVSQSFSSGIMDYAAALGDQAVLTSSTPNSPLNSSIDYKAVYQEVPAIFHRGGGRRGGIRLGSGAFQDLSLLLTDPASVPKSPLAHSAGRRSTRSSLHSASSTPSSRVHHLSLSNAVMKTNAFNLTDSENESLPLRASPAMLSFNPRSSDRSLLHHASSRGEPGVSPGLVPNETLGGAQLGEVLPLQSRAAPLHKESPSPNAHSEDVGNLLRVLLAVSSKYDFSRLKIRMRCHCVDLNPNAPPDARLCYDFLNSGVCKREQLSGICRFRHLPADHIETIVDKIRNGKVGEQAGAYE